LMIRLFWHRRSWLTILVARAGGKLQGTFCFLRSVWLQALSSRRRSNGLVSKSVRSGLCRRLWRAVYRAC
jgi:hypothetical protein